MGANKAWHVHCGIVADPGALTVLKDEWAAVQPEQRHDQVNVCFHDGLQPLQRLLPQWQRAARRAAAATAAAVPLLHQHHVQGRLSHSGCTHVHQPLQGHRGCFGVQRLAEQSMQQPHRVMLGRNGLQVAVDAGVTAAGCITAAATGACLLDGQQLVDGRRQRQTAMRQHLQLLQQWALGRTGGCDAGCCSCHDGVQLRVVLLAISEQLLVALLVVTQQLQLLKPRKRAAQCGEQLVL
jgi:hypothetical protein